MLCRAGLPGVRKGEWNTQAQVAKSVTFQYSEGPNAQVCDPSFWIGTLEPQSHFCQGPRAKPSELTFPLHILAASSYLCQQFAFTEVPPSGNVRSFWTPVEFLQARMGSGLGVWSVGFPRKANGVLGTHRVWLVAFGMWRYRWGSRHRASGQRAGVHWSSKATQRMVESGLRWLPSLPLFRQEARSRGISVALLGPTVNYGMKNTLVPRELEARGPRCALKESVCCHLWSNPQSFSMRGPLSPGVGDWASAHGLRMGRPRKPELVSELRLQYIN